MFSGRLDARGGRSHKQGCPIGARYTWYLVPGTIMTLISLMGIHTTYFSSYALPVLSYELLPAKYIDKDDRCYLFNSCFIQHMAVSICRTCSSSTARTHSTYDVGIQSSLRINSCRRMWVKLDFENIYIMYLWVHMCLHCTEIVCTYQVTSTCYNHT